MRVFLSTGEPSGDLHAANLIHALRALRPDASFHGYGGPKMKAAGADVLYPLTDLAVMWFGRVLLNIRTFLGLVDRAADWFDQHRPDVVVVIDYPGFNWWIARKARARGIPVVYFVPPQIWAWAGWRIKKIQRDFNLVLCSLPFEPAWYAARGFDRAEYIGHPYFDELAERVLDHAFLDAELAKAGRVLALLPGSRTQEVHKNLPIMLRAAAKLHRLQPDVRFEVACFNDKHRAIAQTLRDALDPARALPITLHVARTPELIRVAELAWAKSGSSGLELLNEALPAVVLYKIGRFDLWVARQFIKSKYISLVNLLADREIFPEYLTPIDVSDQLADWAARLLADPAARAAKADELRALRDVVAKPGATARAAARIVALADSQTAAHAPFRPLHASKSRATAASPRP